MWKSIVFTDPPAAVHRADGWTLLDLDLDVVLADLRAGLALLLRGAARRRVRPGEAGSRSTLICSPGWALNLIVLFLSPIVEFAGTSPCTMTGNSSASPSSPSGPPRALRLSSTTRFVSLTFICRKRTLSHTPSFNDHFARPAAQSAARARQQRRRGDQRRWARIAVIHFISPTWTFRNRAARRRGPCARPAPAAPCRSSACPRPPTRRDCRWRRSSPRSAA